MENLNNRPLAPQPYDLLPPAPSFLLESDDLKNGAAMPLAHTKNGDNLSPHLRWSGFPTLTRSFVITCFDPDAPTPSGWWHWTVVDYPSDLNEIEKGAGSSDLILEGTAFHLRSDSGDFSYMGAEPPAGDRAHRYIFAVHALDTETLDITDEATPAEAAFYTLEHTLARATLTVTYQRPSE